jgi:hypothetical protein
MPLSIVNVAQALERAQPHAIPGRKSVECNSVLRELHHLLDRDAVRPRERLPLRLVTETKR